MKKLITIFLLIGTSRLWGGDCPKPSWCEAFEYAKYAEQVYHDNDGEPEDMGCWKQGFPSFLKDGDGFYAEVYKENGEYVIAFRGTKEFQDYLDNLDQALNGHNEQFEMAMTYFKMINIALDRCDDTAKRTIVGHSLGGALAQYVASFADERYNVVTFNPATLLPDNHPISKACVFNYVNENDLLDTFLNPLLAELHNQNDGITSGKVGIPIPINTGSSDPQSYKYDFRALSDITAGDFNTFRELLAVLNSKDSFGNKYEKILAKEGINELLEKFKKLFRDNKSQWPGLAEKYEKFCDAVLQASAFVPSKNPIVVGELRVNYDFSVVWAGLDFKKELEKVFNEQTEAHKLGEVTLESKREIELWEDKKKKWEYGMLIWEGGRKNDENMKKIGLQPIVQLIEFPKPDPLPPRPDPKYESNSLLSNLQTKCNDDTSGDNAPWHPPMAPVPNPPGTGIVTPPTGSPGIIGISPPSAGDPNPPGGTIGDGDWGSCTPGEGYKKGTYQKMLYNK